MIVVSVDIGGIDDHHCLNFLFIIQPCYIGMLFVCVYMSMFLYNFFIYLCNIHSLYFSNKIHKGKTCYFEEQVISVLEFLIDNICVSFGGTQVSAGRRHNNGYELCPSSSRFISILI